MPIALQAMTKAAVAAGVITDDLTEKYGSQQAAMEKLMEQGKLYSADVLPFFGEEIRKVVEPGLERALKSNMNAWNRLKNVWEDTANVIFTSGFGEGLTEVFNNTAEFFKRSKGLWISIGRILGSVFKAIGVAIKVLTPIVSALGTVLEFVTGLLGDFAGIIVIAINATISKLSGFNKILGKVFGAIFKGETLFQKLGNAVKRFGMKLLLPLALLEELVLFFKPDPSKKTFLGADIDDMFGGMDKMVEKMLAVFKPVQDFFDTMFSKIDDTVKTLDMNQGNAGLINPYGMANMQSKMEILYPASQQNNINLNVQSDVYLESEKVGSGITNTRAFREGVGREMNNSFAPNY